MMIKVEAIVREEVFEDVKEALNAIDVNGITVSQVMGCGAQRGYKKRVRGTEVDVMMQPKIKFEIVVSSEVHFALFGGRKCVLERSLCGA